MEVGAQLGKWETGAEAETTLAWLEGSLMRSTRRVLDSESLDMPLQQLPLAQLRLASALYAAEEATPSAFPGETMGRLSDRLGVKQNALTQSADRLISHGLAERLSDAHDRRIVRLRLTEPGRALVSARHLRRRERLHRLWASLSPAERDALVQAVTTLEGAAERWQIANLSAATACGETAPFTESLSRFTADALPGELDAAALPASGA